MDDCFSLENMKFLCAQKRPDVRYTAWITGDHHVYSFDKNYQMCSFNQILVKCFDNEFFCQDQLINANLSLLTEIRVVLRYNKEEFTFLANENTFSEKLSSKKSNASEIIFTQDGLNQTLLEIRAESADY
jgi:hypothetical protein